MEITALFVGGSEARPAGLQAVLRSVGVGFSEPEGRVGKRQVQVWARDWRGFGAQEGLVVLSVYEGRIERWVRSCGDNAVTINHRDRA